MNNNLENFIETFEDGQEKLLIDDKKFSTQILFNKCLECSLMGGVNFVNVTFQTIDFTGSFLSASIFEKCRFNNVLFRKAEFWNCTFLDCQITDVDLTRSEFNGSTFTNCEFLNCNLGASYFIDSEFKETIFRNSNLNSMVDKNVKVWKFNKWIDIKDFSSFEKDNDYSD
jgi:uncharacterized protein YjbI with pentapeptide repeats